MAYFAAAAAIAVAFGYGIRRYFAGGRCNCPERLDGKTVVITGGNAGMGRETAVELAKRGARVIIACRDVEKSKVALEEIKKDSKSHNVFLRHLDLASFASIRVFAKDLCKDEKCLHILINNAGVAFLPKRMVTSDGLEMQMGVNHFGHFLLTNLLVDHLKASAPSRVIVVSSQLHRLDSLDFSDLQMEKSYSGSKAFNKSKLANVLFAQKLHHLVNGSGVSVFSLHPGVVATDPYIFQRGAQIPEFLFNWFVWPILRWVFLKTPNQGIQTCLFCCLKTGLEDSSGQYFADCSPQQPSSQALDNALADKLWEVSARICGL